MICKKCHAEVPEGQLTCTCFQVPLDKEIEERALNGFADPRINGASGYIYQTASGHLSPTRNVLGVLMFCGKQRYKSNVETSALDKARFREIMNDPKWKDVMCIPCAQKVSQFL